MFISNKLYVVLFIVSAFGLTAGCGDSLSSKEIRRSDPASVETNSVGTDSGSNSAPANTAPALTSGSGNGEVVNFSQGSTSKSYSKSIAAGTSYTYTLKISAGQKLVVNMTQGRTSDALFTVKDPSGNSVNGGGDVVTFDDTVNKSGNYKIIVKAGNANSDYDITFSVTGSSSSAPNIPGVQTGTFTKTVKFNPGRSSADYPGVLSAVTPDVHTYVLGAKKGQTMEVQFLSNKGAKMSLIAPNGYTIYVDRIDFNLTLPQDGNYKIVVETDGSVKLAEYSLNLSIV